MRFPIRPGKVTCAGIVVIFMVLPNSIWKGPDAKDAPVSKVKARDDEGEEDGARLTPSAREIPGSGALSNQTGRLDISRAAARRHNRRCTVYGVTPAILLRPSVSRIVAPHGSVTVADIRPSSGSRPYGTSNVTPFAAILST